MESTGIYWMPIYEILEDAFSGDITLLVVNARHMKNVPGKKQTCGIPSGFPPCSVPDFWTAALFLKKGSGFRLSSFISDIFGASGKNIILHLIEHGKIDRTALDSCLKTKTRNRIDEIGVDMKPFKTAEHICSWAGLCPGNNESVALARKLLVIIYTMLKQGTLFDESCFEARRKNCEQKQLSRYIRELEKHGYHVEAQG